VSATVQDCGCQVEWPCTPVTGDDPSLPGGGPRVPGTAPVARRAWRLVAPWWKWSGTDGRGTPPAIQKYSGAKAVSAFVARPQRTLRWRDEDTVFATRGNLDPVLKLFLPTHDRSYLVVCELHCDAPGFPSAKHDDACQAGFVVRRRGVSLPSGLAEGDLFAKLGAVEAAERAFVLAKLAGGAKGSSALVELQAQKLAFAAWAGAKGLRAVRQGWFRSEHEQIGEWRTVEPTPPEGPGEEAFYPLFPLIPDPDAAAHDAQGRAIWFGAVPVNSPDTDASGRPRYDPESRYEIRAFVRRHDPRCPRRSKAPDCRGEAAWSAPTTVWQIAPPFDLDGAAHRPVTLVMPDLVELEAQASPAKASVRLKSPAKSSLEFDVGSDNQPIKLGFGEGICGFSIPLITIVASFVIKLFLPIVTFLFGLFFLLKLKFCIPGGISASMEARLDAELGAAAGGALGADLGAEVSLPSPSAGLEFEAEVNADAAAGVSAVATTSASATAGAGA